MRLRSAIALALVAAGAILAFTVSAQVPGISLRGAGVIIMLTGIAVAALPPSPAADWLRRRPGHAGPAPAGAEPARPDEDFPDYLLQDPAVLAAEVLNGIRSDGWWQESGDGPSADRPDPGRAGGRTLRSVDDLDRQHWAG